MMSSVVSTAVDLAKETMISYVYGDSTLSKNQQQKEICDSEKKQQKEENNSEKTTDNPKDNPNILLVKSKNIERELKKLKQQKSIDKKIDTEEEININKKLFELNTEIEKIKNQMLALEKNNKDQNIEEEENKRKHLCK